MRKKRAEHHWAVPDKSGVSHAKAQRREGINEPLFESSVSSSRLVEIEHG
jgi:hypothetical protein